jgi:hypothetical protein
VIAVIQCAARKRPGAGHLETPAGKPVVFVAVPRHTPPGDAVLYAHPDEMSDYGMSWREALLKYNENPADNPQALLPACQLYAHPAYERLVGNLGIGNVFILSAGWGLLRADFLTPAYDITFSRSADRYKQRRPGAAFRDFRMLPPSADQILFFGGKDYVPLFCALSAEARGQRVVFTNSVRPPQAPGCTLQRFQTTTRTNWHYACARAFIDGRLA